MLLNNSGEPFDDPPIVPCEANNFSDILYTLRGRPVFQDADLFRIRFDALFSDDMSKVYNLLLEKFTL